MALGLLACFVWMLMPYMADGLRASVERDKQAASQFEVEEVDSGIPPQYTTCDGELDANTTCTHGWLTVTGSWGGQGCPEDRICCNCRRKRAAYTTRTRTCHPS